MRTRSLTEDEFRRLVIPAFRSTFQDVDPFGEPLRDALTDRLILWPMDYRLGEGYVDAIAEAAAAVRDGGFYVVETEAHSRELLGEPPTSLPRAVPSDLVEGLSPELTRAVWVAANRPPSYAGAEAWWFSLDDLEPAKGPSSFGPYLETAVISPTGQWAVIISHEGHAVAGGGQEFIETLVEHFPPCGRDEGDAPVAADDQVIAFLREVKASWQEPMKWLPRHLVHVYGVVRAAELLRATGFR